MKTLLTLAALSMLAVLTTFAGTSDASAGGYRVNAPGSWQSLNPQPLPPRYISGYRR